MHWGLAGTSALTPHSAGVLAAPIDRLWNPRIPFSSKSAALMSRCLATSRLSAKASETTTTLKWDLRQFGGL